MTLLYISFANLHLFSEPHLLQLCTTLLDLDTTPFHLIHLLAGVSIDFEALFPELKSFLLRALLILLSKPARLHFPNYELRLGVCTVR